MVECITLMHPYRLRTNEHKYAPATQPNRLVQLEVSVEGATISHVWGLTSIEIDSWLC
jgi:hypothetical protein